MRISRFGLIISLFLFFCMLIISLLSFNSSKRVLSELAHLKTQNETINTNLSHQENEIEHLQLSIDQLPKADSVSVNDNLPINEPIISMAEFRLFSPSIKESINLDEGFTLRAEININAVNHIAIHIMDSQSNKLETIKLDDNLFDEGVDLEWTPFFLKVRFDNKPTTEKGIIQIEDLHNNDVINFPIYFD